MGGRNSNPHHRQYPTVVRHFVATSQTIDRQMTKIIFLLLFPLLSFAQTNKVQRGDFIFKGPIYSNPDPKTISSEIRQWKDSLNFIVVRGKYISGALFVEIFEDKQTKIYDWKQFFPNGQLKEIGTMTKDEIIRIGKWIYYFEDGKIDTIIDYDKMLLVPYLKALDIAGSYNFKMPELDVDLVTVDNKQYWQFRKWLMKNGDGISSTILISSINGSMRKPTEEVEKHN